MTELLTLSAGRLEVHLSPAIGGCIKRFDFWHGDRIIPILRGADGPTDNVLDAASFPLVPFVNRIRDGRFAFSGRTVILEANMAGDPSPLHGQGWLNPWTIRTTTATEATLEYRHAPGEWPWAYEARQHFELEDDALTIKLTCRNMSADPMPCGLGQHPYYHCGPETRLETKVGHVWTIDEHVLPVERVAATGRFDLSGTAVCGMGLDHGFDEWSGSATVTDPNWPFRVAMSSPDASFFQLYSPSGGGIFVIEPVTHANAALNEPEDRWSDLGIRVLQPGEDMTLATRFDVLVEG